MILIFSDFHFAGPYSGAMQAAVMRYAGPKEGVVNLMLDAPDRDPMRSAYLLAALRCEFRAGDIGLCVVDPGVGSARRALVVRCDDSYFVGPDNGLFEVLIRRAHDVCLWQIDWEPDGASASFHGRDIFGPVAGMLAAGTGFARHELAADDRFADARDWPDDLAEVIYIDGYGNAMTGLRASHDRATASILTLGDMEITRARTFSDVPAGQVFWYENSFGLVEIAVNGGAGRPVARA
ncbi:S-adenosyl-l-methionine hydroxide adenosyltransferase family protein [Thalassospira profundimaris]|uniref:SAM hydrolase/SAM-dependent halogenase family protein n=1 Tax=Thalassospira profundimaris TaxID=502049 RepID=UPI000DEDFDF4|nr:SAM-dependent chlorinase/fluorinase [Thalassospira profundimaris]